MNAMIEAAHAVDAITPPGHKPAARDDLAAGFSFAAALGALEARAAQSLETFGARPQDAAPAQKTATSRPSDDRAPAKPESKAPQPEPKGEAKITDVAGRQTQTAAKPAASAPQPAPSAPQNATAAAAPAANTAPLPAAPLPQQSTTPTARIEAAAAAKADIIKTTAPKAPRLTQPYEPQQATQDFARLLARRLEGGATKFDLRLDPPELGRVEAQLKVGDKGEAVLSLKFEHQAALDLFARDADALRAALTSSGFDLGGERLAFSLADESAKPDAGAAEGGALIVAADNYDPLYLAPYSRGAVDLRV